MNTAITAAQNADKILLTTRNLEASLDWLRTSAGLDAPDIPGRCLHLESRWQNIRDRT